MSLPTLMQYPQWVLYDRATKLPHGSTTDPTTWLAYETARNQINDSIGLGFVFTRDDPFAFIDIDNAVTPTGEWNADAQQALQQFPEAAWETSKSGKGLHGIVCAPNASETLADRSNRFNLPNGTRAEFYTHSRYVALGYENWTLPDVDSTDVTTKLQAWLPQRSNATADPSQPLPSGPAEGYDGPPDDDKLIERMLNATGSAAQAFGSRANLADLWNATDTLGQYFPADSDKESFDRSSADASLMAHLAFWTGKDAARMERIFSRSQLAERGKWQERPDYRARTVLHAVAGCDNWPGKQRHENAQHTPPPSATVGERLIGAAQEAYAIVTGTQRPLWEPPRQDQLDKNDHLSMIHIIHHELEHDVRLCEFSHTVTVDAQPITDAIEINMWLNACAKAMVHFPKNKFLDAIVFLAGQRTVHPVRDWLNTKQASWDQTPRLDTWLTRYAGAPDNRYTRAVAATTLIGAVRRIRQPGCKHDTMMVLEGPQGVGKSTLFESLVPNPAWFTDAVTLSMETKEIMEVTRGRWIVEAPELSKLSGAEVEHVKALLSRKVDSARMAYARNATDTPRQFMFMGSTNSTQYLIDQTGNRRFLPIVTGTIDLSGLTADREQLWAEAAHREALGESNMLPETVWADAAQEQSLRMYDNPYEEILHTHLANRSGEITRTAVCDLLEIPQNRRRYIVRDVDAAMENIGWKWITTEKVFRNGTTGAKLTVRSGVVVTNLTAVK